MKKLMQKTAIIITALLLVPNTLQYLPNTYVIEQAQAAAKKPVLSVKEITTWVGAAPEKVEIKNKQKGAKYSFYSSNKKVAAIDKYGKLTAISKGKCNISVKQTYKNKVTTIGTCSILVETSSIDSSTENIVCGINGGISLDKFIKINYKNKAAAYSYEVDKDSIGVITDEYFRGTSNGTANISVYETYKGKKRELGSVSVTVKEITMKDLTIDPYYIIDGEFNRILYYDDITANKTMDMKTTLLKTPSNASEYISYLSSDQKVATVDKNGMITAVGKGKAVITAIWGSKKIELEIISISTLEEDGY